MRGKSATLWPWHHALQARNARGAFAELEI
jgi:hypothetical protein